jgi:predicted permease
MGFIVLLTQSVLPVFIILGIANVYYRYFRPNIKQLVDILLYIFAPAVVFSSLVKDSIGVAELGRYLVLMVLVTAALMALGWLGGKILGLSGNDATSFLLSVSMINIGNFGVPLIFFTYGDSGLYPSIMTFVAFNIPLVTIAIYLSSGQSDIRTNIRNVMKIPIFHSTVLALVISSLGIPVPEVILKLTGFLGQAAFPLFIFVLGLQLATIRLNAATVKTAMAAVLCRLVISPFIAAGLLYSLSFSGLAYSVALVQTAGPSALLPLMYAIKFDRGADLLAAAILLSTAVSAVTLPLVIYFAG